MNVIDELLKRDLFRKVTSVFEELKINFKLTK